MAKAEIRMTEGPIAKQLVSFAIPLFLGFLFQQLYNTADALIVGNLLGNSALAARYRHRYTHLFAGGVLRRYFDGRGRGGFPVFRFP